MTGKNKKYDFYLQDQNENDFRLSDYRSESRVLLSFHPLAWTPVCQNQMEDLENNYEKFKDLNIVPVGISVDSTYAKKAWAEEMGLENLRLLSDFWPHGEVAQEFNIFRNNFGFSKRANILIDKNSQIEFKLEYDMSVLPDIDELLDKINKL